ncbi:MAG: transposase [Nitrospirota bacterium]
MKNNRRIMQRKATGKIREVSEGKVTVEVPLPLASVLMGMPQVIRELAQDMGILLMTAVMESECALGLDKDGRKHIMGLREGATENKEVCIGLLEDMARRGLSVSKDYLFVLDGSKALRSAVTRMFGSTVAVQRCQQHKRRNVREYLPPEHQEAIDARIRAAYGMLDYEQAKHSLELTVKYLERLNPSAAASLREGLEETLTVHRLGITGLLRKTLCTTNPIESCFSMTRAITGRVKWWRNGEMVHRWAVAALLRAEMKFRRIKGYREIPKLMGALGQKSVDRKEVAA